MTFNVTLKRAVFVLSVAATLMVAAGYSHAHGGPTNKVAVEVCKQKVKSQACQYEGGHTNLYIGTCQYMSETDLICVRNQPIQKIESHTHEGLSDDAHKKLHDAPAK